MLPLIIAQQLKEGLSGYLRAAFPMQNGGFKKALDELCSYTSSLCREPWISVRLPFRTSEKQAGFRALRMPYLPYLHQEEAFSRLNEGRSSLIATGTGSGKTECFLYPILEYCWQHRGEKGIKAVIIYPMNALASDQAGRLAKLINENDNLKNTVSAGIYVGTGKKKRLRRLSSDNKNSGLKSDRDYLRENPPDILLTNYKMLDYMLLRAADSGLWRFNGPRTLKFAAVDELHTFDGAQGTDLACLLRRLKARLETPEGYLCCIGTSATMGSGREADKVAGFASKIFGEAFEAASVITEKRLSFEEFFGDEPADDFTVPSAEKCRRLKMLALNGSPEEYLKEAAAAWLDGESAFSDSVQDASWRLRLAGRLKKNHIFRTVIRKMENGFMRPGDLAKVCRTGLPDSDAEPAVTALLSLISYARTGTAADMRPFLTVKVQLWFREQRNLLASVASADNIKFGLYADESGRTDNGGTGRKEFRAPVLNCRSCGSTGWLTGKDSFGKISLSGDPQSVYRDYFSGRSENLYCIYPEEAYAVMEAAGQKKDSFGRCLPENEFRPKNGLPVLLCPECLNCEPVTAGQKLCNDSKCHSCGGTGLIPAWLVSGLKLPQDQKNSRGHYESAVCPCCGSRGSLSIMGLRITSAVSVCLSLLMTSLFNDDRKELVFSDSVQDAAHRAGFFNCRTWRFCLRSAVLQYAQSGGSGLSLARFEDGFSAYLSGKRNWSITDVIGRLIAPNMVTRQTYEAMCSKPSPQIPKEDIKNLYDDVIKRCRYEIMLGCGLESGIGRTLLRSGCLAFGFKSADIMAAAAEVRRQAADKCPDLAVLDDTDFARMVTGWLHLLRRSGAFCDPVFKKYAETGEDYLLSNKHIPWLPRSQKRRLPKFVANTDNKLLFHGESRADRFGDARFTELIRRCCGKEIVLSSIGTEEIVSRIILKVLADCGILKCPCDAAHSQLMGIDKDRIYAFTDLRLFVCSKCGRYMYAASEEYDFWNGAPCTFRGCSGSLAHVKDGSADGPDAEEAMLNSYYRNLYSRGSIVRVAAREHSGLLTGKVRGAVEKSFKKNQEDRKAWDVNVLSCTPTLEMGIDIGDLSTVVMCGVPPAQAQFLQRAGRGGRRDGSALNVVAASAVPHDLYFYAAPRSMFEGEVHPPTVFLEAGAVLERQFLAYCLDCWVKSGEAAMPSSIRDCLKNFARPENERSRKTFPYSLFSWTEDRRGELAESFLHMFAGELDESVIVQIRNFAEGKGEGDGGGGHTFAAFVDRAFAEEAALIAGIQNDIALLRGKIDELKALPKDHSHDELIEGMEREKKLASKHISEIKKKNIFNFLSDSGLLPNYAFPEEGAVLRSVLYRDVPGGNGDYENNSYRGRKRRNAAGRDKEGRITVEAAKNLGRRGRIVNEYVRPAASAISEFAPGSSFYAEGHRLKIDQLDVKICKPEEWRFCPNCSHAEPELEIKNRRVCPRCGSREWADAGQKRIMLRLRMAGASDSYEGSLISDDSDERRVSMYRPKMFIDADEEHDVVKAFRIDTGRFSFGWDFLRRAVMREINFGPAEEAGFEVNGETTQGSGFNICTECGMYVTGAEKASENKFSQGVIKLDEVASAGENVPSIKHAPYCPHSGLAGNSADGREKKKDLSRVIIYRQFETEVLRLLVPAVATESDAVRRDSFAAAFMLGMRRRFGNVDHLRTCTCLMPGTDENKIRRSCLAVYDSVPGGTGYIKHLQKDGAIMEVFRMALQAMQECKCLEDENGTREPGDGCYRCLYSCVQGGSSIKKVSKKTAIDLFREILEGSGKIQEIKYLSEIPVDSLMESRLEEEFAAALGRMPGVRAFEDVVSSGGEIKKCLRLKIDADGGDAVTWRLEPQVSFDRTGEIVSRDSGAEMTRADFVLWPERTRRDGSGGVRLPIAVFADGFSYHCGKGECRRLDGDTEKRLILQRSGRVRTWVLCWEDIHPYAESGSSAPALLPDPSRLSAPALYAEIAGREAAGWMRSPSGLSSLELLLKYMQAADADAVMDRFARAYAVAVLDSRASMQEELFRSWSSQSQHFAGAAEKLFNGWEAPAFRYYLIGRQVLAQGSVRDGNPGAGYLVLTSSIKLAEFKKLRTNACPCFSLIIDDTLIPEDPSERDGWKKAWNAFWQIDNVMQFAESGEGWPRFAGLCVSGLENGLYDELPEPGNRYALAREWGSGFELLAPPLPGGGEEDADSSGADYEGWKQIFADGLLEGPFAEPSLEKLCRAGFEVPECGFEFDDGGVYAEAELAWPGRRLAFLREDQDIDAEVFNAAGWRVLVVKSASDIEDFLREEHING